MSREFPDWVNPWSAAEGRRVFQGTLPLSRMRRLRGLLVVAEGEAWFRAEFSLDGDKRPVIRLEVAADLPLLCQASLQEYLEPVRRNAELAVIESEAEQALLPDHCEPVLASNGRLALLELVEDELLLGMPQVPRRPDLAEVAYSTGDAAPEGDTRPEERRPFARLAELLGRARDTDTE